MVLVPASSRGTLDVDQYATGLALPYHGNTATLAVASRAYFVRYVATANLAVTKIAVTTTVAATNNDNCDVGIFNAAGTTLLSSAGSTAGKMNAAAGVQQLTLLATVNITQGTLYWVAFAYGAVGGTAATLAMTSFQGNSAVLMGAFPNATQTFQAGAFPLAAPIATGGAIGQCPVMGLLA